MMKLSNNDDSLSVSWVSITLSDLLLISKNL